MSDLTITISMSQGTYNRKLAEAKREGEVSSYTKGIANILHILSLDIEGYRGTISNDLPEPYYKDLEKIRKWIEKKYLQGKPYCGPKCCSKEKKDV